MALMAEKYMQTTPLGAVPVVDTLRAIFVKKGLRRYNVISTLNLESILYKMAKEGKTINQAIAEVFPNEAEKQSRQPSVVI